MNEVKVSVIIPVFNAQLYLEKCLDTVLSQSLKDIELICVDDGSTDNSPTILKRYREKDNRITILTQKHSNAGVSRNKGLKIAKGKYLSFLDADDFFEQNMLEDAYEAAEKYNVDIVVFGAYHFNDLSNNRQVYSDIINQKYLPKNNPFQKNEIKDYLFNTFGNCAWNKLFKKELISKNNIMFQSISRSNDILFTNTALACSKNIYVINKPYVNYRIEHENHIQSSNSIDPIAFIEALKETKKSLEKHLSDEYQKYEKSLKNSILRNIIYNLSTLSKKEKEYLYAVSYIAFNGEKLFSILNHEDDYYYNKKDLEKYKEIRDEFNRNAKAFKEIEVMKENHVYSFSLIIAKTIKMIKNGIKCLKENGSMYTIKKIRSHTEKNG